MAEKSLFWFTDGFDGAIGDGSVPYTQDEFARYNASTGGADGVFAYSGFTGFSLATSGTASPLTVTSGGATVRGLFYFNDADTTVAVSTPLVGTTGGRVILRADYTAATIRLAVKRNTDGVAAIPALTQIAGDIWEIGLSEFTITTGGVITVTDNRSFAKTSTAVDVSRGIDWDSRNRLGIADDGVTAAMVADDAINTANIVDSAVTAAKIANRTRTFLLNAVPYIGSEVTITGVILPDNQSLIGGWQRFFVPTDYVSDMTINSLWFTAGSGNLRVGVGVETVVVGDNILPVPTETLATRAITSLEMTAYAETVPTITAGDYVFLRGVRYGADALDTVGAIVYLVGWLITYTADS